MLAEGNFAITVVLLQKFAEMAARYIPQWEIIDYAHDDKKDAPSGTALELPARRDTGRTYQWIPGPFHLAAWLQYLDGNPVRATRSYTLTAP